MVDGPAPAGSAAWSLLALAIVHSSEPFGWTGPGSSRSTAICSTATRAGCRGDHAAAAHPMAGLACATLAGWRCAGRRCTARSRFDSGPGRCACCWQHRRRPGLVLLSPPQVPVRGEVRPGDHRRTSRRSPICHVPDAEHADRQRQHRRDGMDVRHRRAAPALDAPRPSGAAGRATPVHLLGVRRRRRHDSGVAEAVEAPGSGTS